MQKLAGKRPGTDHGSAPDGSDNATLSLDDALTLYKTKLGERGARTSNAGRPRHHLSEKLLAKPVSLISEKELKDWRDSMLASGSAPSSVNRTMTNLRAALTIACPHPAMAVRRASVREDGTPTDPKHPWNAG